MKARLLRYFASVAVSGAVLAGSAMADDKGTKEPPKVAAPMKSAAPIAVAPSSGSAGHGATIHTTPAPIAALDAPSAKPADAHWSNVVIQEGCGTGCCPPEKCTAWGAFADFLYLKARDVDVVYARTVDGCIPGLATPRGPLAAVQPSYSPGFRAGFFYGWDDSSVVATYTWFNSNAHDTTHAGDNRVIQALITLPGTQNCASNSNLVDAEYGIDFHLIDLDFRHAFCSGSNYSVDYILGVRYAHLDQDFRANFNILGTTTVESQIRFDGVGPRVGLAGERIACNGLLVYGRGTAAFLAGHFNSTYEQRNNFAGVQGNLEYDNDRIVPLLDMEVGVGWASKCGRFRVEAGYYVMGWFNVLTTPGLIRGVQQNEFSGTGDVLRETLGFDGFTVRAAVKF